MVNVPTTSWVQANLTCESWQAAEHLAAEHLRPLLTGAEDAGDIGAWWFIRKCETWRFRFRPVPGREEAHAAFLAGLKARLGASGAVRSYVSGIVYEPEIRRFGGPEAIEVAHGLFHADSRHILNHLARHSGRDVRRELGVRLATRLMHAADQDFYEQGDIWGALAEHRVTAGGPEPSAASRNSVQMLITAAGDTPSSPLTQNPTWPSAFEDAGRSLADLARRATLTRGVRAILTDHLAFAFNRLGISADHQAVLAGAASQVVFHRSSGSGVAAPRARTSLVHPTTVRPVTMDTTRTTADARALRDALVARIDSLETFRTKAVRDAFRAVPRHLFLPEVDLATAYTSKQVVTKRAVDGTALSSASSPNIVATMLEQLQAAPGQRVLEIGAATGINAALLAEIVGSAGSVVTLELDDDLAQGARRHLADAGYERVRVLCRDGALGDPDRAPFDGIIVTAGAWDIPAAWWAQLAPGGRLVVPLRLHGSGLTRSIAFTRTEDDRMVSTNAAVCGFVPLRGAAEMGEIHVRLADDAILKVDAADQPDRAALTMALTHPAHQRWTGLHIRHDEPAAHLDLWLATAACGVRFGKLAVGTAAPVLGLAAPAVRWSGAALYDRASLAYLTTRVVDEHTDELGISAHGPNADTLAGLVEDLLHHWDEQRPAQPVITAYPSTTDDDQLAAGARISRPDTRLTVAW